MIQGDTILHSAAADTTTVAPPPAACPVCGGSLPPGVREEFCPACLVGDTGGGSSAGTGRVLGDCELFEEIGRGGMGVVWRGRQRGLHRDVAVKTLPGGDFAGAEARARFHIEAQAAARLNHPNIVAIHDVGEDNGMPYFVMELVPGRTLAAETADRLPAPRTAATWVQQAALGVQHAHEQGVLHRDLKPSNIIIEPDPAESAGRPRVMDFGLAKLTDTESGLTMSGSAAGSPAYMAPEAVRGGAATALGDVYGLGAVLYTALTGRAPFSGESVAAVLAQVEREEPLPPRRLVADVPRDLETICLKCLEKNPAQRYASAALLAADLGRFLNSEPVLARPVAWPGKLVRWAARRPALAAALALTFLALAATAIISTTAAVRIDRERKSAEAAALAATHTTAELHGQEASRRMEQGDFLGALPSLVAALKAEEQDPARARTHAVRLSTALGECPRLLHLWDFGRQKLQSMAGGADTIISANSVLSASFSPDGRWLACANGWSISLFDTETGAPERGAFQHPSLRARPAWVAFAADGGRLLEGSLNGQLTLWDFEKRTPIVSGMAHALGTPGTSSLFRPVMDRAGRRLVRAQSGKGDRLAWGGAGGLNGAACQVHDAATGERVNSGALQHTDDITALAFSPDVRALAIGGADRIIRLIDTRTWQAGGPPLKLTSKIKHISFSKDGRWVVGTDRLSHTRVWDATTSQPITPPLLIAPRAETSWLTDDGQTLIVVGYGLSSSMATRSLTPGPASTLITRAELLSGHRHDPVAGLVPIPQKEIAELWEKEKANLQGSRPRHREGAAIR